MKRPYSTLAQPGKGFDKLLGELELEIMWPRGDVATPDPRVRRAG